MTNQIDALRQLKNIPGGGGGENPYTSRIAGIILSLLERRSGWWVRDERRLDSSDK